MAHERVTVAFEGGPCGGHTVDLDPRDVYPSLQAVVVDGTAYVLNTETVFNDDVMKAASAEWVFEGHREYMVSPPLWTEYERVPDSDPPQYRPAELADPDAVSRFCDEEIREVDRRRRERGGDPPT